MLYNIFVDPFVQMADMPDLLVQVLWEGTVAGVLYALIALGFVLIFKASGVFNFAQGAMVFFAALMSLLYYVRLMPLLVRSGGRLLMRWLGTSGPESFSTVALASSFIRRCSPA